MAYPSHLGSSKDAVSTTPGKQDWLSDQVRASHGCNYPTTPGDNGLVQWLTLDSGQTITAYAKQEPDQ